VARSQVAFWLRENAGFVRIGLLLVDLLAFLAPWSFSSDGMPPAEYCQPPNFVQNERCVRLVRGAGIVLFMVGAFPVVLFGVLAAPASLAERARELLGTFLYVLFLAPIAANLLLLPPRESNRVAVFSALAWGAAAGLSRWVAFSSPDHLSLHSWGIWLAWLAADIGLTLEIILLILTRQKEYA
jgi:hypothetical protein